MTIESTTYGAHWDDPMIKVNYADGRSLAWVRRDDGAWRDIHPAESHNMRVYSEALFNEMWPKIGRPVVPSIDELPPIKR
ncbi:hypothetical protein MKK84_27925 [Methylobacterium sp. E-065]|uniref:hypothetical protein n=1 Tax=Methylobacterium sp. E-065 TaxID=2836583 RepID=UPI001FB8A3ED|nr:hypothetical protein [Methylobacterium sp. E-065]MCJ2021200.1 hypothetical protein [Methylobacterium sp. E-065]